VEEKVQKNSNQNRIFFLDNLRTFMIFLVVALHCGLVYEKGIFSSFYWIVYDPVTNPLVLELRIILDIFVMATIFFISGYFTPTSVRTKSTTEFIYSKFRRLVLPWIIAVLTLIPAYKIVYLYSRDLPQQPWATYFHWSNEMWGQNWLWFLPVLFIFNLLYLPLSKVIIKIPALSLKIAVAAAFVLGLIFSISMDLLQVEGWTKSIVMDFQNERVLIYIIMFLLGAFCFNQRSFDQKPGSKKFFFIILCLSWIPILVYRNFYLSSLLPDLYIVSELADLILLWLSFHLSLFILIYLMITVFKYYFECNGKFSTFLNNKSYHIYIIHVIVLGLLALLMLKTPLPSIIKFLLLTGVTFTLSSLLSYFYKEFIQIKMLRRKS